MSDYNAEQATQENQNEPSVTQRTIEDMKAALGELKAMSSRLIAINNGLFGRNSTEEQKVDIDIDGCFVDQRSRLNESIFDEIGDINSEISRLEGL